MNKARSALTILGIVIGIAAVIVLIAVGEGATKTVTQNISALGSNLIVVIPGSAAGAVSQGIGTAQTLTMSDANILQKQLQYVNGVSPEIVRHFQITYGSSNTNTSVIGANPIYASVHNVTINRGNFFSQQQDNNLDRVAVLGPGVSQLLFGNPSAGVGKQIEINGIIFNIIGVANIKGGTNANSPDNNIYIPLKTAQQYLFGQNQSLTSISISAANPQSINIVEQETFNILLAAHGIKNPANADFQLVNQSSIVASLSSTTQTLTALLGSIAGISLLVAGIGIMNMMLTTVTERTREIGLRKAVGAKKKDIGTQFLNEAIALTLIGGIIGILLGLGIIKILSLSHSITVVTQWWSIIIAFGVSMLIGTVFGYYPAQRAAKLKPIDALKYE
jgi:putative ABC transport system permease protein